MARIREEKMVTPWSATPLTALLIAVNLVCFVLFGPLVGDINSNFLLSSETVLSNPQSFLLTGFMHASILHLVMNMLVLSSFRDIEAALGSGRYGLLYGLSLLGSSLFIVLFSSTNTVGASGAIFGLLGAMATLKLFASQRVGILITIAINGVITLFIPLISWQAHLGGLLTGAVIGLLINRAQTPRTGAQHGAASHPVTPQPQQRFPRA